MLIGGRNNLVSSIRCLLIQLLRVFIKDVVVRDDLLLLGRIYCAVWLIQQSSHVILKLTLDVFRHG